MICQNHMHYRSIYDIMSQEICITTMTTTTLILIKLGLLFQAQDGTLPG